MDPHLMLLIPRVERLETSLAAAGVGDPGAVVGAVVEQLHALGVKPLPSVETDLATAIGRVAAIESLAGTIAQLVANVHSLGQTMHAVAGQVRTQSPIVDQRISTVVSELAGLAHRVADLEQAATAPAPKAAPDAAPRDQVAWNFEHGSRDQVAQRIDTTPDSGD